YERIRDRGFDFLVNPTLHAKFALLDEATVFLGSANCTAAGMQLGIKGNWEAGTSFTPSEADRAVIEDLFAASVLMTDSLYADIKNFANSQKPSTMMACSYPPSIADRLQGGREGLWVRELPWTESPDRLSTEDDNV